MMAAQIGKTFGPEQPMLARLSPYHAQFGYDIYKDLARSAPAIRDFDPRGEIAQKAEGVRSASQPTSDLTSEFMAHKRFADRRSIDRVPDTESMVQRLGDPGNEHWKWPREPGRIDRAFVSDDGTITTGETQRLGRFAAVPEAGNDEFGAAFTPYDRVALSQAWRNKVRRTGELFSNPETSSAPGLGLMQAVKQGEQIDPRETARQLLLKGR